MAMNKKNRKTRASVAFINALVCALFLTSMFFWSTGLHSADMETEKLVQKFKSKWRSPIVPKKELDAFTGGLLQPQTLTNLISEGKAPKPFYIRGRAVFDVDVLLEWLLDRMSNNYNGFEIHTQTPNYKK